MALGVPVVGGKDSGAIPWLLDDGAAGILVDTRNPIEISAAVSRLLDDDCVWRRYSAEASDRARRCFNESAVVQSFVDAYEMVISR